MMRVNTANPPSSEVTTPPWRIEALDEEQISAIPGKIEVQRMTQTVEVKGQDEDWTGKTNTTLRRKLQNRLNQRASRKRRKQNAAQKSQVFVQAPPSKEPELVSPLYPTDYIQEVVTRPKGGVPNICMYSATRRAITGTPSFAAFMTTPLPVDQKLMTLLHFNLVRALVQNACILGLDPDMMEQDIPSPFQAAASDLIPLIVKLPPTLKPTELQLTVPHHPEVDGFPFPVLRDNFIRAGEAFDADEFCMDMLYGVESGESYDGQCKGRNSSGNGRTGLIIWSDPWLSGSWEIEEKFARKYRWLLEGCTELIEATNFWRRSRGEGPLRIEELVE